MSPSFKNEPLFSAIQAALRQGSADSAIAHISTALSLAGPADDRLLTILREVLERGPQTVQVWLLNAVTISSIFSSEGLELFVMLARRVGQPVRALSIIQQAMQQGRSSADLLVLAGQILAEVGEHEQARTLLSEVLQNVPSRSARLALENLQIPSPRPRDSRLVLFVSESPKARLLKMAHILRKNDWRVVLISRVSPDFDATRVFEEVKIFNNPEHALYLASSYSPRVIHLFSPMADDTSCAFIRERGETPVIFDPYDIIEGLITAPHLREVIAKQRYCMENSDGLTCRDLRSRYVWKKYGYKHPDRRVFFSEYCWAPPLPEDRWIRPPEQELHVVCCGFVATARQGDEQDWGYLEVGKLLAGQGIHFHIYPHPLQAKVGDLSETFADFVIAAQQTSYFHFHEPVAMDRIQEEIARYDFGINISVPALFGRPLTSYTEAHLRYCSSARNTEYLDSGLPLLSQQALRYQYNCMKRYGLAIDLSPKMLALGKEQLFSFRNEPSLPQRVKMARSYYSLDRHAPRLMRFYSSF